MSRAALGAEFREEKGHNHHLRKENRIPAVVYGGKEKPLLLSLAQAETERFLNNHHVGSTLDLKVGDRQLLVLLKEIQLHPVTRKVQHMDFQRLMADEKVKVNIPIFFTGIDDVRDGIIIQEMLSELEIETLPRYLVDSVSLDVSQAVAGDAVTVADLPISKDEHYTIHTSLDSLIYNAVEPKAFVEHEGEAEEGAEDAAAAETAPSEEA